MNTGIVLLGRSIENLLYTLNSSRPKFINKDLSVFDGRYLIEYLIERLRQIKNVSCIGLAMPYEQDMGIYGNISKNYGVKLLAAFPTSPHSRALHAAKEWGMDNVIMAPVSCQFIDPVRQNKLVQRHERADADITIGLGSPDGTLFPVISIKALERSLLKATSGFNHSDPVHVLLANKKTMVEKLDFGNAKSAQAPSLRVISHQDIRWATKVLEEEKRIGKTLNTKQIVGIRNRKEAHSDWWGDMYRNDISLKLLVNMALLNRLFFDEIISAANGPRLLETGIGSGGMSVILSMLGYSVTGLDFDAEVLSLARDLNRAVGGNAEFIEGNILNYLPEAGQYDLVFHHGVLEHFSKPEIKTILKLQLQIADRVLFSVPSDKYGCCIHGDENLWSLGEWRRMLKEFRIVKIFHFNPIISNRKKLPSVNTMYGRTTPGNAREIGFVIEKKN